MASVSQGNRGPGSGQGVCCALCVLLGGRAGAGYRPGILSRWHLVMLRTSWPHHPSEQLWFLTVFTFSFRPLFREGKSLLHRKSDALRLITNTWLECWRITLTLLPANRRQLCPGTESQIHNQERSCWCWGLKTVFPSAACGCGEEQFSLQNKCKLPNSKLIWVEWAHGQCDVPC